ncbi:unnamed protein product [Euphydryas editha]|uniref:Uncharacterized protein n=1 Tax=Euphydryas editha TaxID=104508 RepID=A0AAU9TE10_EUPED|nr:unnamed protein product [Euphydryas editha]
MGSVKQIQIKPNCVTSRFDYQANKKHESTSSEPQHAFIKRQRISTIKENEETIQNENYVITLPSCSLDKYESDELCTPSIAGSMVDYNSTSYKLSSQSKPTSDANSQEELEKRCKSNSTEYFV